MPTGGASRCPFLKARAGLERAADSLEAAAGSTLHQQIDELGLEFRREGRGLDFWRKKWKEASSERAIREVAEQDEVQVRLGKGKWLPVSSMEQLQLLVGQARTGLLQKSGESIARQAAGTASGLPGLEYALKEDPAKSPSLLSFAGGMLRHYDNPLGFLQEFHAKHGRSFQVSTPTHGRFLFDTHTDTLIEALSQTDGKEEHWKKSELQTHGAAFLIGEKNMFASGGGDWSAIHDAISPLLSSRKVRSPEMMGKLTQIFDGHIERLKARVQASPTGELEIDARGEMQRAVLDVALKVFMSTEVPPEELVEIQNAFNTQMSWLPEETINPTEHSLANLPGMGELRGAYKLLDGLAQRILEERRQMLEKPGDMLEAIMEAEDPETGMPLSDRRLKHEILSLLEAGHETTATMLGWGVLMMSRNPAEFRALQREVDEKLGDASPSVEQMKALEKPELLVKETLRMYPPFYLFMREATTDTTLGDLEVKKGTTLVSSLYNTHRDEGLWGVERTGFPANEFHSERFEVRPPEKFVPFGAGKRSCAGRVLGMLEGQLMLTRMAQTFEIMPDHSPIESRSDLSIHPKEGKVTLRLRDLQESP